MSLLHDEHGLRITSVSDIDFIVMDDGSDCTGANILDLLVA